MNYLEENKKNNVMFSSNKYNLLTISSSQIKDLNISTPECQRAIDSEQVNKIVSYQVQHYNLSQGFLKEH